MINLYEKRTNTITISDLYSKVTIPDASLHYVFNFVDVYNNEVPAVLVQQNADQTRSSKFYFTDSSDGTIKGSGEYNIYESPIDSSVIDASIMNLLENGQYTYVPETDADLYYDPSLFDYLGHDVVFDPIFGTGSGGTTSINHDDLSERNSPSNHPWALPEASLGTQFSWESGLLTVDASVESVTALSELTDTEVDTPAQDDILQYNPNNTAPNKWKNQPPADATQWFYTKAEIDAMLTLISGGQY